MRRQVDGSYRIEPIDDAHIRDLFSCGIDSLDHYLQRQAGQDARRRVAAPFVLVEPPLSVVIGYYTLSSGAVELGDLPQPIVKKLPRYPSIPVTLLGRLAVDEGQRGKRLGEKLLMDAMYKSLQGSQQIVSAAVIVRCHQRHRTGVLSALRI